MRILIAGVDAATQQQLLDYISPSHETHCVATAADGWTSFETHHYQLIIVSLRDLDGVAFCEQASRHPVSEFSYIIGVATPQDLQNIEAALQYQLNDYWLLPLADMGMRVTLAIQNVERCQKYQFLKGNFERISQHLDKLVDEQMLELSKTNHQLKEEVTALKRTEEAYRNLVDHSLQGLVIIQDGRIVFANPAFSQISGYSNEALLAMSPRQVVQHIHPHDRSRVLAKYRRCMNGHAQCFEYRGIRRDKTVGWVQVHASRAAYRGKPALQLAYIDITDRKNFEHALQKSEERYRIVTDLITDYAYLFGVGEDGSMHLEWVTGAFSKITGYDRRELPRTAAWQELIHPDDMSVARNRRNLLLAGHPSVDEFRIVTRSGEVKWVRDYGRPIWDEKQNRVVLIYGAAQDVTFEKRAEESLLQLEKAVETMQLGLTITNPNGQILYVNPAEARMHGYYVSDLIGKDVGVYALPGKRQPLQPGEIPRIKTWTRESVNVRKDRSTFMVKLTSDVVMSASGEPTAIVTTCEDITERKRAEKALQESQHLLSRITDTVPVLVYIFDLNPSLPPNFCQTLIIQLVTIF